MQNNRRIIHLLIVIGIVLILVPTYVRVTTRQAHATGGQVYYVDADEGKDICDGKSPSGTFPASCPWASVARVNDGPCQSGCGVFNPGNVIQFEDGETWQEPSAPQTSYLHPPGSGTSDSAVITVTDYCIATEQTCTTPPTKPILNGEGDQATLYLDNQQYFELSNLEIRNTCAGVQGCMTVADRKGIWVFAHDYQGPNGILSHIYVSHMTVHDVFGLVGIGDEAKLTGGIIFQVKNVTGTQTKFDNVNISSNIVHDVKRTGIFLHSDWKGKVGLNSCHLNNNADYYPSTRVVVDSNIVYNTGGSGIGVQVSTAQQISNNIVYDGQQDPYHSEGIVTLDSNGAVIEGNLVYGWAINGAVSPNVDAVSFDSDDCDINAMIQYNFAHNNQGGFLLVVYDSQQAWVRYNVSERDGYGNATTPRDFLNNNSNAGTGSGMHVYDNDIYLDDTQSSPGTGLIQNQSVSFTSKPFFENNLIYSLQTGSNASCAIPTTSTPANTDWMVDANAFYAAPPATLCSSTAPTQTHAIPGDPKLTTPGGGYNAAWPQGVIAVYTLLSTSPARCTGLIIPDSNNNRDFADMPLPTLNHVDGGALEYDFSCT